MHMCQTLHHKVDRLISPSPNHTEPEFPPKTRVIVTQTAAITQPTYPFAAWRTVWIPSDAPCFPIALIMTMIIEAENMRKYSVIAWLYLCATRLPSRSIIRGCCHDYVLEEGGWTPFSGSGLEWLAQDASFCFLSAVLMWRYLCVSPTSQTVAFHLAGNIWDFFPWA